MIIGNFSRLNGGAGIVGIGQELFDLMAANITQNAAVFRAFVKPRWAFARITKAMRPKADDLQRTPDGSSVDQTTCFYRAFHMQTFAEIHKIPPPGA